MGQLQINRRREWFERLEEWKASGKNVAQWCRDHRIPVANFRYWQRRLEGVHKTILTERLSFVELPRANAQNSPAWIEIRANGLRISLEKDYDADVMHLCTQALRAMSC